MANLSIILPDPLAKASQEAAKKLGVSRTQFIRLAIIHELENFQSQQELEAMAHSMMAMKHSQHYLTEAEKIMNEFDSDLPKEGTEWWSDKK